MDRENRNIAEKDVERWIKRHRPEIPFNSFEVHWKRKDIKWNASITNSYSKYVLPTKAKIKAKQTCAKKANNTKSENCCVATKANALAIRDCNFN